MGEPKNLKMPTHIGFIMDGNRRWAKANKMPTMEGYRKGFDRVTELVDSALTHRIPYITIHAFSTDNWNRDGSEIKYLMNLARWVFQNFIPKLHEKGIKVIFAGRLSDFDQDIREKAQKAMDLTKDNKNLTLNIAFSYGGRAEIVDMTKKVISDGLSPEEITEEKLSGYIYEKGQPDLDLVVRTSGEKRTSGFMLWQAAYAELIFLDIFWPDFDKKAFEGILEEYDSRERRFGK